MVLFPPAGRRALGLGRAISESTLTINPLRDYHPNVIKKRLSVVSREKVLPSLDRLRGNEMRQTMAQDDLKELIK